MLQDAVIYYVIAAVSFSIGFLAAGFFGSSKKYPPSVRFLYQHEIDLLTGETPAKKRYEEYLNSEQFPPAELLEVVTIQNRECGKLMTKLRVLND